MQNSSDSYHSTPTFPGWNIVIYIITCSIYLLSVRHHSKHIAYISLCNALKNEKIDYIIINILQMKRLKHTEVK